MRLRAFLILSLDGHAAGPGDDLSWHEPLFPDFGPWYEEFITTIGTVVMGRRTFDLARGIPGWRLAEGPWPGRDTVVLTSRPVTPAIPRVTPWREGAARLLTELRGRGAGQDTWVMGGPATLRQFQALGAIHQYDLFLAPLLLGGGTSWAGNLPEPQSLALVRHRAFPSGTVHLTYARPGDASHAHR